MNSISLQPLQWFSKSIPLRTYRHISHSDPKVKILSYNKQEQTTSSVLQKASNYNRLVRFVYKWLPLSHSGLQLARWAARTPKKLNFQATHITLRIGGNIYIFQTVPRKWKLTKYTGSWFRFSKNTSPCCYYKHESRLCGHGVLGSSQNQYVRWTFWYSENVFLAMP